MRAKYSAIAAAVVVFFCSIILILNSLSAAHTVNDQYVQSIEMTCRLSASMLDSAANSDKEIELLTSYAGAYEYKFCLFDGDGKLLYSNCTGLETLDEVDLARLAEGGLQQYRNYHDDTVDMYNYAIIELNNGGILRVGAPYVNLSMWAIEHAMINLLLLLALFATVYVIVYTLLNRQHRMITRIIAVLESFSEGHYGSRIEGIEGDSVAQTRQFNAAVARLEEHVFKTGARNRALNSVMNQMKSGILVVDSSMKVILISAVAKQLLQITGNPEGMYIGKVSKDIPLEKTFIEAMGTEGVFMREVAARSDVGRGHKPLRLYISTMIQNGKVVGLLAMIEDITELKHLEEVRTDFAANVSHELKTPLTSIRGFVETLQDGAIENPVMARKFLRIIDMETQRLTRLINDILSISKLESGNDAVETERISVDKIAEDVNLTLSVNAKERGIKLEYAKPDKPIYIIGNKDRVVQIFINLIENGIKYNKPNEGSVCTQVFSNPEQGRCTIIISDTGIGVAQEHLPRLFERFYRVDKGRSRSMGGTGLGLAIVKHIVTSMKGDIDVSSKLGEGTEFVITLPLAKDGDTGSMGEKMDTDQL